MLRSIYHALCSITSDYYTRYLEINVTVSLSVYGLGADFLVLERRRSQGGFGAISIYEGNGIGCGVPSLLFSFSTLHETAGYVPAASGILEHWKIDKAYPKGWAVKSWAPLVTIGKHYGHSSTFLVPYYL